MPTHGCILATVSVLSALAGATGEATGECRAPSGRSGVVDTLTATLRVPERVEVGVTVPVVLEVENRGGGAVLLYVTGRPPALDLVVEDDAGRIVWRRLEGETVSMVLNLFRIEPGNRREFRAEWNQRDGEDTPVPPGVYRVRARLLTEGDEALEAPAARLRIGPG